MPLKGETDVSTQLNVKTAVDLQPTELKINPAGKITVNLPGLKVHLPAIKVKLWFLPIVNMTGLEVSTEPMSMEVDLSDAVVQGKIERTTHVDLITSGEVKARARLQGAGSFQGGPITLEIPD